MMELGSEARKDLLCTRAVSISAALAQLAFISKLSKNDEQYLT